MKTLNILNCFLFPKDKIHSHFTLCDRMIKAVKKICLNRDIKNIKKICKIAKMDSYINNQAIYIYDNQRTDDYINMCNLILKNLTNLAISVSPEYVIFKHFKVPFIEKNNLVIICSSVNNEEIDYFSFTTGELIKTVKTSHQDIGNITKINNMLITCSGFDEKISHSVKLFDITSGNFLDFYQFTKPNCYPLPTQIDDIKFITSYKNLLAITSFETTYLYNIVENTIEQIFNMGGPIILTEKLLIGYKDDHIIIYGFQTSVNKYEIIWSIQTIDGPSCICIYDSMLIYGGDGDDYNIIIFDMKNWKLKFLLKGHISSISSLVIDNNFLFSGSIDKTIKMWNIDTGDLIKTFHGHKERVTSLVIKDNYLISGDWDNNIFIWDLTTDKVIKTIRAKGWINSLMLVDLKYAEIN